MTKQTPQAETAVVPLSIDGEPCSAWEPTIQDAGVDTIEFSFDEEISSQMWEKLEAERLVAQLLMKERRAVHVPDWLNAQVSPIGARGGYHFLLEAPTFAVKLLRGVPGRPPIYVEMRAFGLHTHPGGAIGACEEACTFLREVLLADCDPEWAAAAITLDEARCSRLDLFLDWQGGWHPAYTVGDERHFVKRSHADVNRRSADGNVTGYEIGSGVVRARIYNKTVQTTKAHIEWHAALLAERNGARYDPSLDVWRLEFQLRREGVKGFKLYAKPEMSDPDEEIEAELDAEDLPYIHSVRKALHWAGQLWHYLTHRWLRLTVPTETVNRGRWPEHPTWVALRTGFAPHAMAGAPLPPERQELIRSTRYRGYERLLNRMAVGVLTTETQMDTDPGAALVAYTKYLYRIVGHIRRKQKARLKAWERKIAKHVRREQPFAIAPDLSRGMGARLDSLKRWERRQMLLEMALGVFTSAGVVELRLQREADVSRVSDLLIYSLDELEAIADEKGSIRQLLEEKWCKVYKAHAPRGLFSNRRHRNPRAA
jgi:hypothetical protein